MLNSKKTNAKVLYFCIISFCFILITFIIKYYFMPLFIILSMIFMCMPIFNFLYRHKIFNRNVSAVLAILSINILVFLIIFYTGKAFITNVTYLIKTNYTEFILQVQNISNSINGFLKINFFDLNGVIKSAYSQISYNNYLKKGALYTTQWIFTYFISNISVYFILVDRYVIVKTIEKFLPRNNLKTIKVKINEIHSILQIELILILTTTLETFFGLVALNIENALFISLLCGLLDLIPYIGTIIVFIPLIIYNIIVNKKIIAFGLILLYILLQITRQIAEAKFVSNRLKIHPLVIILGGYIGVTSLGFVGLFIVPLFIIVTREIIFST